MSELMFDGWYSFRSDAEALLELVTTEGATPLGIVEGVHGTYGVLYTSAEVLFPNHRLDEVIRDGLFGPLTRSCPGFRRPAVARAPLPRA